MLLFETSIEDIVRLINAEKLKERKIGFVHKGKFLGIDKNDKKYTKTNCDLSCHYLKR
jgi:hypothetical protein